MLTELILIAADAGYMRILTGVNEISNETIGLCASFVAHYNAKAVSTDIKIAGPMSAMYYDNIVLTIRFVAAVPRQDWEAIYG